MLGDSNSEGSDGGWLVHDHQDGAFGAEVLVDRDKFGFVVGQGLVPDSGAVLGDGAGPVVGFPYVECEEDIDVRVIMASPGIS